MVQTALVVCTIVLQLVTIYILLQRNPLSVNPSDGERSEKPARRFVTPFGSYAVESHKRKITVNDDDTLFDREAEKR